MPQKNKLDKLTEVEVTAADEAIGREYRSHNPNFSLQGYEFEPASRKGNTCIVVFHAVGFIPFDKSGQKLKCSGNLRIENGMARVTGCRFDLAFNAQ